MSKRQWEKKKEEEEDRTTYKKKVKAKAIQQQPPQIQKTLDCSPAFPGPTSTRYGVAYPIAKFLNKCQTDHISRWHQDDETQKKKKGVSWETNSAQLEAVERDMALARMAKG